MKKKIRSRHPDPSRQIEGEKWKQGHVFLFLGSKIIPDSDCSCEIKRLLLGNKVRTNLDSILKTQRYQFA